MQSLKKKTEGFTIIEVMIVLVIAAVIILIVFLAVPALQRNSRNNERRNDASRISSAVVEWQSNNGDNTLPVAADLDEINSSVGEYKYYNPLQASQIQTATAIPFANAIINADPSTNTGLDALTLVTGARCANNTLEASARSVAVLYAVEVSGGRYDIVCL